MMNTTPVPPLSSLEQARGLITSLQDQLQQALWRVRQLEKELYGASSEQHPDQNLSKEQILLSLFPAPALPPATQQVLLPSSSTQTPRVRRQASARVLERVTQRLEPEEKLCPKCGKEKCEIGCEKSERLEYVPARIVRYEIVRPKLACPCGQSAVSIAPLPPTVVAQGQPAASLVAHVLLSKYVDHLPLYRQREQFGRLGLNFPKSTLGDWVEKGAAWLQPVVRQMKLQLLSGDYLQVDETPVRVQDPEVEGKCATGWLWVASTPGGDVIFEFRQGRGKEFAQELIGKFQGYLQRDGYGAYGALARANRALVPVGCWAHARRKFIEAVEHQPNEAAELVNEVLKLYLVEQRARDEDLGVAARLAVRQQVSLPILRALRPRLERLREKVLPQSPLRKAIDYCLSEWPALTRYVEDGRLEIDNNLIENAIRPSAVGKKNWLFIGHPQAGWRSAVIYSIVVSCRRRGIEPWDYLRDVLGRLPAMKQSELASVLPANWQPA